MKFKKLAFFACIFSAVVLACSCGGGGGGGNEGRKSVAVGLEIKSIDGNIDKVSGRDIRDVLAGAKYYYKANAAWSGDDALTAQGTQNDYKEFVPGVTKFIFAAGQWRIDILVKSERDAQLYTTKLDQDGKVPKTNINVGTKTINVILEKNLGGEGNIDFALYVPDTGDGMLVVKCTPIDGGDTVVLGPFIKGNGLIEVTDVTDPNYGTLRCDPDATGLPAGVYNVVIEYWSDPAPGDTKPKYGDDPANKDYNNPAYAGKVLDGGGVETVNVFGNESSDIVVNITPGRWEGAVITINGIHVIDATITCDVAGCKAKEGTPVVFKATPKTGIAVANSNWITYIEPDSYQWYIDGQEISGATGATYTYDTTGVGIGYKTVSCRVSKHNAAGKVEYAAQPSVVLSVTP